jgi:hypothetical protein
LSGNLTIDLVFRNIAVSSESSTNFGGTQVRTISVDSQSVGNPYTVKNTTLSTNVTDINWEVKGVADFNKDGVGDLLWRNKVTGENAIWLMKNSPANGIELDKGYFLPSTDNSWSIRGVGDFDKDGKQNILWQRSNGEAAIWGINYDSAATTNPLSLDSAKTKAIKSTSADWGIQGWADFNKDGIFDIFWQNTAGDTGIWEMKADGSGNDPFFSRGYLVYNVGFNSGLVVEGAADFNRDGINDIIWRNAYTNETVIWNMQITTGEAGIIPGETKISQAYNITPPSDANWQLTAVVDLNQDSTPDFVWSNYATGENAVWEMKLNVTTDKVTLDKGYYLPNTDDFNWRFAALAYSNLV